MVVISRYVSDAEQRYARVEKEALAVTWACERLNSYLIGHFMKETDHKQLLALELDTGTLVSASFIHNNTPLNSHILRLPVQHQSSLLIYLATDYTVYSALSSIDLVL